MSGIRECCHPLMMETPCGIPAVRWIEVHPVQSLSSWHAGSAPSPHVEAYCERHFPEHGFRAMAQAGLRVVELTDDDIITREVMMS